MTVTIKATYENGVFKPDGTFRTFVFDTTGDTDNRSGSVGGLAQRGAWGGLFQLTLDKKQESGDGGSSSSTESAPKTDSKPAGKKAAPSGGDSA